jgi:hypothetical protein
VSTLDRILARLPKERHQDFLHVVHDVNVRPDSPDFTQAYLAVEALSPMLDEIRKLASSFPDGMKAAAGEILRGIRPQLEAVVRDIATETGSAARNAVIGVVREDMHELVTASAEHLGRTLRLHEDGVRKMQEQIDKSSAEGLHAAKQMRDAANDVRGSWRDLQGHTFLIAIIVCMFLVAATAGIAWKVTWDRAYHAGAYVERAAILHRASR